MVKIHLVFLPWFGDFFACFLVKDADLVSLLQILAIKYQAMGHMEIKHDGNGPPKEHIRDLPTTHVFDIRTNFLEDLPSSQNTNVAKHENIKCIFWCVHREVFKDGNLRVELMVKLNPLRHTSALEDSRSNKRAKPKHVVDTTYHNDTFAKDSPLSSSADSLKEEAKDWDVLSDDFLVTSVSDDGDLKPELFGPSSEQDLGAMEDSEFLSALLEWSGGSPFDVAGEAKKC